MAGASTALGTEDFFGFDSGAEDEEDEEVAAWRFTMASRPRLRPQSAVPCRSASVLGGIAKSPKEACRHSVSCELGRADSSRCEAEGRVGSFHIHDFNKLDSIASGKNTVAGRLTPMLSDVIRSLNASLREECARKFVHRSLSAGPGCVASSSRLASTAPSRFHTQPTAPVAQQTGRRRPSSAGGNHPTPSFPAGWVRGHTASSPQVRPPSQEPPIQRSRRPSSARHVPSVPLQTQQPLPSDRSPRDLNSLLLEEGIRGHTMNMPPRPRREPLPMHGGAEASCVICLEKLRTPDSEPGAMQALACGHAFHTSCIRNWLATSPTCPLCKTKVVF